MATTSREFEPLHQMEETTYSPNDGVSAWPKHKRAKKRFIAVAVLIIVIVFIIAFVIGYFVRQPVSKCKVSNKEKQPDYANYHKSAVSGIASELIEKHLRSLTSVPHYGGSNESYQQAVAIKTEWEKNGLDKVELKRYDILLSFPSRPGIASIEGVNGTIFTAQRREKILQAAENDSRVLPPFNAYSASGNVQGKLVYVNYARAEDFQVLKSLNVSTKGKILLARYGKIFRGDKGKFAQAAGAIGLILYTDPKDYSSVDPSDTYPKSWWMPPTGVQRGTLWIEKGDPLTPGFPSKDGIYREPIEEAKKSMPKIPVYPISYGDATLFLKLLKVKEAPADWQGGIKGVTYKLSMDPNDARNVSLDVQMKLETRKVYNVIGTFTGSVEPDRMVLLGNHRDGWIFGAVDPSSGTAAMMEVARQLGIQKRKGWKPRRSIVLISWGAEEHGLMGSNEWAEDFSHILKNRAVAYLNVDLSVQGNYTLRAKSSPLLDFAIFEASKKVESPSSNGFEGTVYDEWKSRLPDTTNKNLPVVSLVGSGSDYANLYHTLGVPSLDIRYTYDKVGMKAVALYPVYHSVHDTFHWVKTFVDRDFHYHRAVAQVWIQLALVMADSPILPFNCSRFAQKLKGFTEKLMKDYGQTLSGQNITLDFLKSKVDDFVKAAERFQKHLDSISNNDVLAVRMANDRLIQLERSFIEPLGLPGRPFTRHVLFAPSRHNAYAGAVFPGIVDTLYEVEHSDKRDWEAVKKQLSVVIYHIGVAIDVISLTTI